MDRFSGAWQNRIIYYSVDYSKIILWFIVFKQITCIGEIKCPETFEPKSTSKVLAMSTKIVLSICLSLLITSKTYICLCWISTCHSHALLRWCSQSHLYSFYCLSDSFCYWATWLDRVSSLIPLNFKSLSFLSFDCFRIFWSAFPGESLRIHQSSFIDHYVAVYMISFRFYWF